MNCNLRKGFRVRVKSAAEIIATLDEDGRHERLPFMPEMLEFCGKEFVVSATAHKTCDTVNKTGGRSVPHTVHLDDLRCSGKAHGGCDAYCLLFWKEAWLELAEEPRSNPTNAGTAAMLDFTCHRRVSGKAVFHCQATDVPQFSKQLRWWDLRQYVADVRGRNQSVGSLVKLGVLKSTQNLIAAGIAYRAMVRFYNLIQRPLGGIPRSIDECGLVGSGRTPAVELGLRPGDLVEVKSFDEIRQTLDPEHKNRGMYFDIEMRPYCGQRFRVARRVERIINETTGEMIEMKTPAVILSGAYCRGKFSTNRMFCPRALPGFWREIWLRKVENGTIPVVENTPQTAS